MVITDQTNYHLDTYEQKTGFYSVRLEYSQQL